MFAAALVVASIGPPAAPAMAAGAEMFTASTGHRIALTPVESLNCKGLSRKIDEIDATGYRGLAPRPLDAHDRRLFDYENAVSTRYYSSCGATGTRNGASVTEVLRGGFRPRPAKN